MKGHKEKLPYKICKRCDRPFSWRKKWEKNWANGDGTRDANEDEFVEFVQTIFINLI